MEFESDNENLLVRRCFSALETPSSSPVSLSPSPSQSEGTRIRTLRRRSGLSCLLLPSSLSPEVLHVLPDRQDEEEHSEVADRMEDAYAEEEGSECNGEGEKDSRECLLDGREDDVVVVAVPYEYSSDALCSDTHSAGGLCT